MECVIVDERIGDLSLVDRRRLKYSESHILRHVSKRESQLRLGEKMIDEDGLLKAQKIPAKHAKEPRGHPSARMCGSITRNDARNSSRHRRERLSLTQQD
jgi:hypothetical protein